MKNKAFILDMDGTMLDSETIHIGTFTDYLKAMAGEAAENKLEDILGLDLVEICENNITKYGIDCSVEEYVAGQMEYTYNYFAQAELAETDGLTDFLKRSRDAGFRLAVASSTHVNLIELILGKLGVLGYFDAICGHEDSEKPKPEPDIFLAAARKLEVKPEECIVFEDSSQGIVAAGRAGMRVVAVTAWTQLDNGYDKVEKVIKDFTEI